MGGRCLMFGVVLDWERDEVAGGESPAERVLV